MIKVELVEDVKVCVCGMCKNKLKLTWTNGSVRKNVKLSKGITLSVEKRKFKRKR